MNQQNFICPQCHRQARSIASIVANETTTTNTTKETTGVMPVVGISGDGSVVGATGIFLGEIEESSTSRSKLAALFMMPNKPVLETPPLHTLRFFAPCLMVLAPIFAIKIFGAELFYDHPIFGDVMDFVATLNLGMVFAVLLFLALVGSIIYTNSKGYKAKEKHLEKRYHKELEQFAKQEKKHSTLGYCYQCHCIFDQDSSAQVADRKNFIKLLNA